MKGARSFPQMAVRMQQELKDRLAKSAATNNRSLNSEVVTRLEESLRVDESKQEKSNG